MRCDSFIVDNVVAKLKKIIYISLRNNNAENTIISLETLTRIKYEYNQEYIDEDVEKIIGVLSNKDPISKSGGNNTVLFYDGFGLDTRGLAFIYLKALVKLDYHVVYITAATTEEQQPTIRRLLDTTDAEVYKFMTASRTQRLENIRNVVSLYSFKAAFFYSTPWDISGMIAFKELENRCNRFLINLTDHAFWAGRDSVDYCIEFREYGASISHYYRGFSKERLLELPYYPNIDKEREFQGFPQVLSEKRIIFSGGGLYKTIDSNNTFYNLIQQIIEENPDVGFLYAGSGPDKQMRLLENKYPNQVVLVKERSDLYQVLRHSDLYLNTYPISGALMLQYAVEAGCIPVSLVRVGDDDACGILRNEEDLKEIFYDSGELVNEINKLLRDGKYKASKEMMLQGMVISPEEFAERLNQIINSPQSIYWSDELKKYDTTIFREGYCENFTQAKLSRIIICRDTKFLWRYFLKYIFIRIINYIIG